MHSKEALYNMELAHGTRINVLQRKMVTLELSLYSVQPVHCLQCLYQVSDCICYEPYLLCYTHHFGIPSPSYLVKTKLHDLQPMPITTEHPVLTEIKW